PLLLIATAAIWVPLSRKLTVPVVGPGPVIAVTVAVNVTESPTFEFGLLDTSDVIVSTAALTCWLTWLEVEPLNPAIPRKMAVIGWVPTDSVEVVNVAVLVVVPAVTVPWPISTPASRKLTVPEVGGDPDAGVIVAVNVTDWPDVDGLSDEPSDVVVLTPAEPTCWLTVLEVEVLNPDPFAGRKTAVIGWVPTDSVEVVNVAVLVVVPAVTVPWPISTPASRTLTVPEVGGDPDAGVTVAVNVTDWPDVDGLSDEPSDVVVLTPVEVTVRVIGADVLVPNPVAPP